MARRECLQYVPKSQKLAHFIEDTEESKSLENCKPVHEPVHEKTANQSMKIL